MKEGDGGDVTRSSSAYLHSKTHWRGGSICVSPCVSFLSLLWVPCPFFFLPLNCPVLFHLVVFSILYFSCLVLFAFRFVCDPECLKVPLKWTWKIDSGRLERSLKWPCFCYKVRSEWNIVLESVRDTKKAAVWAPSNRFISSGGFVDPFSRWHFRCLQGVLEAILSGPYWPFASLN